MIHNIISDTAVSSALSQDLQKMLQEQVNIEHNASMQYLAMASWADSHNYNGAALFFYKQSEEERGHMLRLIHYINDAGGCALAPMTIAPKNEFKTLKGVCISALHNEIEVSKHIHNLVDYCLVHKAFATFGFLQWFLTEQIEEEATARKHLALFEVIPEAGVGLYEIDKGIGAST